MIRNRHSGLWESLQAKKSQMPHFLTAVGLLGIRGLKEELRVVFDYPVSVIAGGNAVGKSTVLFAAACAYKVPGADSRIYTPAALFPSYFPLAGAHRDADPQVDLKYQYFFPKGENSSGGLNMVWRKRQTQKRSRWTKTFEGRKHAKQPERVVYLRTLSSLINPSEVRGVLQMARLKGAPEEVQLAPAQMALAQRMLPHNYRQVVDLVKGKGKGGKKLLFAQHTDGTEYSELHMAGGERTILRLVKEIAQLENALVLVDEVENGLHPHVQNLLMLELQQIALRNNLQVIVTSHSPIILESVPANGRVFLDRDGATGNVRVCAPYRDVIQNALYGRSADKLNILCEDSAAESVLEGVFDKLSPELDLSRDSVRIGRDTGAASFPMHAAAFKKFGQAQNFVFVLDGDQENTNIQEKIKEEAGSDVEVLFLPGGVSPERWIWGILQNIQEPDFLGVSSGDLMRRIRVLNAEFSRTETPNNAGEIAKAKVEQLQREFRLGDVCRKIAKMEAENPSSRMGPFVDSLKDILNKWRNRE